jgi:hypothetical protein
VLENRAVRVHRDDGRVMKEKILHAPEYTLSIT